MGVLPRRSGACTSALCSRSSGRNLQRLWRIAMHSGVVVPPSTTFIVSKMRGKESSARSSASVPKGRNIKLHRDSFGYCCFGGILFFFFRDRKGVGRVLR